MDLFGSVWSVVAAICVGLGTLSGGYAVVIKAVRWLKLKNKNRKDRLNENAETVELVNRLNEMQKARDDAQQAQLSRITEALDVIQKQLESIDMQVGTIQNEKMMWAYVYYGIQKHSISIETRTSLCRMYDQYTDNGKHNHIPADFKQKIENAPIGGITAKYE